MKGLKILKFRSFISKQQQGFVFLYDKNIPEIVIEDLLFQLFEPFFNNLLCPQIYYFSNTDQILTYGDMIKSKDYVYVHFLERVGMYRRTHLMNEKLKIGSLDDISEGISFNGTNLYIFSEKKYVMYRKPMFRETIKKKMDEIIRACNFKEQKYEEYFEEIKIEDSSNAEELKEQLLGTIKQFDGLVETIKQRANRYFQAKMVLSNILKSSGIQIKSIKDLY